MAYILQRDKAIPVIEEVIRGQDNDLLQKLYFDKETGKAFEQTLLFQLWHGFTPISVLTDDQIIHLLKFFRYNPKDYCEVVDYSGLIQEYADTISNNNTRYLTQNSVENFHRISIAKFMKDLPLVGSEEAQELVDLRLDSTSPATLYREVRKVVGFCDWVIKNEKMPNAQNGFKALNKITYGSWVKKCLVKDAYSLNAALRAHGYDYKEGRPAPVLLGLAMMGYKREEVLEIRNEDVDLFRMTVCDKPIPAELHELFRSYPDGTISYELKGGIIEYYQEDVGFFIKRQVKTPNKQRFDNIAMSNVLYDAPLTFENMWLSGKLCELYQLEKQCCHALSKEQIAEFFKVTSNSAATRYEQIYAEYKKVFWEMPED